MPHSYASTCSDSGVSRICQRGTKATERWEGVGGGGEGDSPHGRENFKINMCIQMAFFGTLKDLLLDPPFFQFFSLSNQGGGGAGSCIPLSYASDSGVTRICQREAK